MSDIPSQPVNYPIPTPSTQYIPQQSVQYNPEQKPFMQGPPSYGYGILRGSDPRSIIRGVKQALIGWTIFTWIVYVLIIIFGLIISFDTHHHINQINGLFFGWIITIFPLMFASAHIATSDAGIASLYGLLYVISTVIVWFIVLTIGVISTIFWALALPAHWHENEWFVLVVVIMVAIWIVATLIVIILVIWDIKSYDEHYKTSSTYVNIIRYLNNMGWLEMTKLIFFTVTILIFTAAIIWAGFGGALQSIVEKKSDPVIFMSYVLFIVISLGMYYGSINDTKEELNIQVQTKRAWPRFWIGIAFFISVILYVISFVWYVVIYQWAVKCGLPVCTTDPDTSWIIWILFVLNAIGAVFSLIIFLGVVIMILSACTEIRDDRYKNIVNLPESGRYIGNKIVTKTQ